MTSSYVYHHKNAQARRCQDSICTRRIRSDHLTVKIDFIDTNRGVDVDDRIMVQKVDGSLSRMICTYQDCKNWENGMQTLSEAEKESIFDRQFEASEVNVLDVPYILRHCHWTNVLR